MQHVAIMNPKVGAIERILSGQKRIESRWYKNKIAPWDKVNAGDTVYFKYSGKPVTTKAIVEKVKQFEIKNLDEVGQIIKSYPDIDLVDKNYEVWAKGKRYCILMWLKDAQEVEPFNIDKTGFGSAAAWMSLVFSLT